ncbi:antitoxin of toxin-antitoxin stability system [Pelagibacterium sp.]|uniref:antitoxin of toxin-antitoxin stability system n=1 Tax=Pelagibacterium sp. TaxID=1967288 RepID=UPI003BAD341A
MPSVIEITVFRLEELSEDAREEARSWYRERCLDYDWYDAVYDDFQRICKILGIRLKTRTVRRMGGGTRLDPRIWFRGFFSQNDGACFEAKLSYAPSMARKIRDYAPRDTALHKIADALQDVQRRNFYQLHADISHSGHCDREYGMEINVERDSPARQAMTGDAEEIITEVMRDLARELYRHLEREYEFLISEDIVDEGIIANDYTFLENGRPFG